MNIQGILKGLIPVIIALVVYDMFIKKMVLKSSYDFEEYLETDEE